MRGIALSAVVVTTALATLTTTACSSEPPPPLGAATRVLGTGDAFVPGELIVKPVAPITSTAPIELGGHRLTPIRALRSGSWLMRVDDDALFAASVIGPDEVDDLTRATVAAVAADSAVVYAHENARFALSAAPTDPLFALQSWHYDQIRLSAARDVTTGSSGARIAILDTGTMPHPDLDLRWEAGPDLIDGGAPTDTGGWAHGTHVGAIAGAATNDGVGGAGVCPGCRLFAVRINPSVAQLEDALEWAAGLDTSARRVDVVNMSFNSDSVRNCNTFPGLRDTINDAVARGVVLVGSAGNHASSLGPTVPATCPGVIAVAASQPDATIAPYSNRGTGVDLVAPGGGVDLVGGQFGDAISCPTDPAPLAPYAGTTGVVSAWSHAGGSCHRYLSGTSMAAPHVTGTVGLMFSARSTLTPADVATILALTARPKAITCPAPDACGAGLLDAGAAVHAAQIGAAPVAVPSPATLDLGSVAVGSATTANQSIGNTGWGDLTISGAPSLQLTGGDGWFSFAYGSGACTSGQSCNRTLTVAASASTAIPIRCAPLTTGSRTALLTVTSNNLRGAVSIAVSCTGTPPPGPIATLTAPAGADLDLLAYSTGWVRVRNDGGSTLTIDDLDFAGADATDFSLVGATLPIAVGPGTTASWRVLCTPSWSFGTRHVTHTIGHDAAIAPIEVDVSCYYDGTPPIEIPIDPPPPPGEEM